MFKWCLMFILSIQTVLAGSIISRAKEGVAIEGYDTVAYFTQNQAVLGTPSFKTQWQGVDWHFINKEHLELFQKSPESYAPQFGGHCAYALSGNSLVHGSPERWKIVDGKLYLNYNWFALKLWQQDIPGNINDANRFWPELKQSLEKSP